MSQTCHVVETELPGMPGWVPGSARAYLAHTVAGLSIRALARASGRHASTILRQVRRMEGLRDDLLVDDALRRLGRATGVAGPRNIMAKDGGNMSETMAIRVGMPDEVTIEREARRVLRRMNEPGACLAVARDMENAVVVRDTVDGRTVRTAVVERAVAEAMALKDWLSCASRGTDQPLPYHGDGSRGPQAPSRRRGRGEVRPAGRVRPLRRPAPRPRGARGRHGSEEPHALQPRRKPAAITRTAEGPLRRPIPLHRDGRRWRTASGGLRTRSDGSADHPELGAVPVIRRRRPARRWCARRRPAGRARQGAACAFRSRPRAFGRCTQDLLLSRGHGSRRTAHGLGGTIRQDRAQDRSPAPKAPLRRGRGRVVPDDRVTGPGGAEFRAAAFDPSRR